MKTYPMLRTVLILATFCLGSSLVVSALGQDVGADIGGGAGIFRPKNPETNKRPNKATPSNNKPANRPSARPTRAPTAGVEERAEDLLDKGNDLRDNRRFAEAEQSYQGVLKLKPRDARAAYGLGNVYSDQQRWESAETAYRNAVQWAPRNADALVALSVVLVQPRAGGENAKRFSDAEAFARRSVQIEPQNAVAWDRLGVALQALGLINSETEHSYRRAIELDPQFAVAYAHLAQVLQLTKRGAEAVPLYDKASELAKDPPTLNLIAESLQAEQQWAKSEPVLKRAIEIDPKNSTSCLLMGRMLIVFKRYQEAEPYLKTATEVSSRAFQPFNLLGRAYLAMDRFAEAEETYERAAAIAIGGDRKQLAGQYGFEGVGDGYSKAKQKENAARAYKRALELDPGNKDVEQKLSKARSL